MNAAWFGHIYTGDHSCANLNKFVRARYSMIIFGLLHFLLKLMPKTTEPMFLKMYLSL